MILAFIDRKTQITALKLTIICFDSFDQFPKHSLIYLSIMKCGSLTLSEQSFLEQNTFEAITRIRSNNTRPDINSIINYLIWVEKLKNGLSNT